MTQPSEKYCGLIRELARKNRLSTPELIYIMASAQPVNPADVMTNSSETDKHGASLTFQGLKHQGLDWEAIQGSIPEIIKDVLCQEKHQEEDHAAAARYFPDGGFVRNFNIGILWCTFFKRRTWHQFSLHLPDAYRPPSLFASVMRENGYNVQFLLCDEFLDVTDLDGTKRKLPDNVDLLYFLTHGELSKSGFEALLHTVNWQPGGPGGIGDSKLSVAVFDACHLINTSKKKDATSVWGAANLGPTLRLLLGFDGPANLDQDMAKRGKAFAENLIKGKTFADAWLQAVNSTSQSNKPVAIGIGDSKSAASSILNSARLVNTPAARPQGRAFFCERF